MTLDGEDDRGTCSIRAVRKGSKKKIEIVQSLSLNHRGTKVTMKSTVACGDSSPFAPSKGIAETRINGQLCMQGTVTFSGQTVDLECTGFLNTKTGQAIDPPERFAKADQPVAKGVLIFQSAVPAIGPRMLPQEGELKNVVFVEFPDDLEAPELITFKPGYRLVRGQPDVTGNYDIKIYSPHSNRSVSHVRFSKDDQILSMNLFGKTRLVEIREQKK